MPDRKTRRKRKHNNAEDDEKKSAEKKIKVVDVSEPKTLTELLETKEQLDNGEVKLKVEDSSDDDDDLTDEITDETIMKFLQYTINYGKYKGHTYQWLYLRKPRYLRFIVERSRSHSPSTHRVLSHLLSKPRRGH